MKKLKNISRQIVIGLVALLVGLSISVQIHSMKGNLTGALVPIQKAQSLVDELKKVREEKENLMDELANLESKIKEIETQGAKEDILIRNIVSELEKYKMISGMKAAKGPGVEVTIDDPPQEEMEYAESESLIMINYNLLLSLINKLNDAGAEAISINGQRYVSITEISLAGSNVNINSVPTAPPFIIKAIGNPDTLDATLNIRFGTIDQMRNKYGLQVKVDKKDEVTIPRYHDVIKFRYAVPVE